MNRIEKIKSAATEFAKKGDLGGSYNNLWDGFFEGAKWQKNNLWYDAQGDDLPEIDREVIALQGRKVVIAHRPNPEGWYGKSITLGVTVHYTPKTYDKGGWSVPGLKYWLDVPLPEGIE